MSNVYLTDNPELIRREFVVDAEGIEITTAKYFENLKLNPENTPPPIDCSQDRSAMELKAQRRKR